MTTGLGEIDDDAEDVELLMVQRGPRRGASGIPLVSRTLVLLEPAHHISLLQMPRWIHLWCLPLRERMLEKLLQKLLQMGWGKKMQVCPDLHLL